MGGSVGYEGAMGPMPWGRATCTAPRRPPDAQGDTRRAGGAFLCTGVSLLGRVGIPLGETGGIRLRPAPDDPKETPATAVALLRAAPIAAWDALTPGRRRGLLYGVTSAKPAGTRA